MLLSLPAFDLLETPYQFRSVDTECYGETSDVLQRWISVARFQAADVRSVDPSLEAQRLLRQPHFEPTAPNAIPELPLAGSRPLARSGHPDI